MGAKFCTCEEEDGGENAIPYDSDDDDDDDDCDIGFVFSLSLLVTAARSSADMAAETGVAAACLGGGGGGSVPFASVVSISEKESKSCFSKLQGTDETISTYCGRHLLFLVRPSVRP